MAQADMAHANLAKTEIGIDLPAHEASYAGFVTLAENVAVHVINIILLLVLWGVEGHPFVALIGFFLNIAASAAGIATGSGWRLPAGVFVLLGVLCILL
jgi:hypothetical protein